MLFSSLPLLLRAATKRTSSDRLTDQNLALPGHVVERAVTIKDQEHIRRFHQVVEWPSYQQAPLHPCYLHTLVFPMHLRLMLNPDFPFALLGLVHIRNRIEQCQAVEPGQRLALQCRFGDSRRTEKGWQFDIESEVSCNNQTMWRATSTNLYRITDSSPRAESAGYQAGFTVSAQRKLSLDADVGRRYARVSGDYNPIHLYRWSAKLFGFKRHIVHGMWSKAKCLSQLLHMNQQQFACSVKFARPVHLPSCVQFLQSPDAAEQDFAVTSQDGQHLHLQGHIRR